MIKQTIKSFKQNQTESFQNQYTFSSYNLHVFKMLLFQIVKLFIEKKMIDVYSYLFDQTINNSKLIKCLIMDSVSLLFV